MGAVVRFWIEALISIFTKGSLHSAVETYEVPWSPRDHCSLIGLFNISGFTWNAQPSED